MSTWEIEELLEYVEVAEECALAELEAAIAELVAEREWSEC